MHVDDAIVTKQNVTL